MTKILELARYLIAFEWLKDWRTGLIVVAVLSGFVAEEFLGLDIPGMEFGWEEVALALGLATAADHNNT